MTGARPRSRFWIVSTHVLTTGLAMPAVAALVSLAVIEFIRPDITVTQLIALAFLVVGDVAGTYYSLSFLKKSVSSADWIGCIRPSVIAFAIIGLTGMALGVWWLAETETIVQIAAGVAYLICVVAFWKITSVGFTRLATPVTVEPVTTATLTDRENRRRIRAAISAVVPEAFPGCTAEFCGATEQAEEAIPSLGFRIVDTVGKHQSKIVWVKLDSEQEWTAQRLLDVANRPTSEGESL